VQWCVLVDPGIVPGELVPPDADDDGDELGDADDVDVVDAGPAAPELLVDASATPVTPAPTPAATTPVMMSRRVRPPILETIGFLPSRRPPRSAAGSPSGARLRGRPALHPRPGSQRAMSRAATSSLPAYCSYSSSRRSSDDVTAKLLRSMNYDK